MEPVMKNWLIQCALRIGALVLTASATIYELYVKKP